MALTDNLFAFYKLSDLTDSSGNNRTLTNNGNVSFASGKIGNAAVFDGSGNTLSFPNFAFGTSNFSFAAWFNPATEGQFGTILQNKNIAWGDGFYGLGSGDQSDGCMRLYVVNANSGGAAIIANDVISYNNWNHVIISRTETEIAMWINGVKQQQTIADFNGNFDEGIVSEHFIGNNYYNEIFNGSIDAVGIWNRALSEQEVAALYNSGNGLELDGGNGGGGGGNPTLVKMEAPIKFFGKVKFGV